MAQPGKTAKKQDKKIVVKEHSTAPHYDPNYKHNGGKVKNNTKYLTVHSEKDSVFEDDNYKHRPKNRASNVITIKREPVDKKDENYKHQFPSGE